MLNDNNKSAEVHYSTWCAHPFWTSPTLQLVTFALLYPHPKGWCRHTIYATRRWWVLVRAIHCYIQFFLSPWKFPQENVHQWHQDEPYHWFWRPTVKRKRKPIWPLPTWSWGLSGRAVFRGSWLRPHCVTGEDAQVVQGGSVVLVGFLECRLENRRWCPVHDLIELPWVGLSLDKLTMPLPGTWRWLVAEALAPSRWFEPRRAGRGTAG